MKIQSIEIRLTKPFTKKVSRVCLKGLYFRSFVFDLYFFAIELCIWYKPICTEDLQWSKEERGILDKQNKMPLKINLIKKEVQNEGR